MGMTARCLVRDLPYTVSLIPTCTHTSPFSSQEIYASSTFLESHRLLQSRTHLVPPSPPNRHTRDAALCPQVGNSTKKTTTSRLCRNLRRRRMLRSRFSWLRPPTAWPGSSRVLGRSLTDCALPLFHVGAQRHPPHEGIATQAHPPRTGGPHLTMRRSSNSSRRAATVGFVWRMTPSTPHRGRRIPLNLATRWMDHVITQKTRIPLRAKTRPAPRPHRLGSQHATRGKNKCRAGTFDAPPAGARDHHSLRRPPSHMLQRHPAFLRALLMATNWSRMRSPPRQRRLAPSRSRRLHTTRSRALPSLSMRQWWHSGCHLTGLTLPVGDIPIRHPRSQGHSHISIRIIRISIINISNHIHIPTCINPTVRYTQTSRSSQARRASVTHRGKNVFYTFLESNLCLFVCLPISCLQAPSRPSSTIAARTSMPLLLITVYCTPMCDLGSCRMLIVDFLFRLRRLLFFLSSLLCRVVLRYVKFLVSLFVWLVSIGPRVNIYKAVRRYTRI